MLYVEPDTTTATAGEDGRSDSGEQVSGEGEEVLVSGDDAESDLDDGLNDPGEDAGGEGVEVLASGDDAECDFSDGLNDGTDVAAEHDDVASEDTAVEHEGAAESGAPADAEDAAERARVAREAQERRRAEQAEQAERDEQRRAEAAEAAEQAARLAAERAAERAAENERVEAQRAAEQARRDALDTAGDTRWRHTAGLLRTQKGAAAHAELPATVLARFPSLLGEIGYLTRAHDTALCVEPDRDPRTGAQRWSAGRVTHRAVVITAWVLHLNLTAALLADPATLELTEAEPAAWWLDYLVDRGYQPSEAETLARATLNDVVADGLAAEYGVQPDRNVDGDADGVGSDGE